MGKEQGSCGMSCLNTPSGKSWEEPESWEEWRDCWSPGGGAAVNGPESDLLSRFQPLSTWFWPGGIHWSILTVSSTSNLLGLVPSVSFPILSAPCLLSTPAVCWEELARRTMGLWMDIFSKDGGWQKAEKAHFPTPGMYPQIHVNGPQIT